MKPTIFHLALSVIASPKKDEWDGYSTELTKTILEKLQAAGKLTEERLNHYVFEAHPDEVKELISGCEIANTFESVNPKMLTSTITQIRQKMNEELEAEAG